MKNWVKALFDPPLDEKTQIHERIISAQVESINKTVAEFQEKKRADELAKQNRDS